MVSLESETYNPHICNVSWTYVMGKETIKQTCKILKHIRKKWKEKFEVLEVFMED